MKQFRIKRIHVMLVGAVLSIGVVVLLFFMSIKPLNQTIAKTQKKIDDLEPTIRKARKVQTDLVNEKATEIRVNVAFDEIMKTRMPQFPYKDDDLASMMYMWDFADKEMSLMARWFASTGAVVTGYSFDSWGFDVPTARLNQPALPALNWNLAVVVKDYADLQRFLKKIPEAPRLLVLQSVTIPGGHVARPTAGGERLGDAV